MTTAYITRIHPPGSTLTRPDGSPVAVGASVAHGARLIHTTPDGAPGCVSLSARGVAIEVRTVRARAVVEMPAAPAPQMVLPLPIAGAPDGEVV